MQQNSYKYELVSPKVQIHALITIGANAWVYLHKGIFGNLSVLSFPNHRPDNISDNMNREVSRSIHIIRWRLGRDIEDRVTDSIEVDVLQMVLGLDQGGMMVSAVIGYTDINPAHGHLSVQYSSASVQMLKVPYPDHDGHCRNDKHNLSRNLDGAADNECTWFRERLSASLWSCV